MSPSLEDKVRAFGQEVPGFSEGRTAHALRFVRSVVDTLCGGGGKDPRDRVFPVDDSRLFLFALDAAWITWMDDRMDVGSTGREGPVEVEALVRAACEPPTTREGHGLLLLRSRFAAAAADPAEYQMWLDSLVDLLRSFAEGGANKAAASSYAEYLQTGETSSTAAHLLATISLIWRLGMPERMRRPRFQRLVHNLGLTLRLQNDLAHPERERAEGHHANAVLLLEEFFPPAQAWAFVKAQMEGHRRLLLADLEAVGPAEPLARAARALLAATERLYEGRLGADRRRSAARP